MTSTNAPRRLHAEPVRSDAGDSYRSIEYTTRNEDTGPDRLQCRCRHCQQAFESPARLNMPDCPSLDDRDDGGGDGGRVQGRQPQRTTNVTCPDCHSQKLTIWESVDAFEKVVALLGVSPTRHDVDPDVRDDYQQVAACSSCGAYFTSKTRTGTGDAGEVGES